MVEVTVVIATIPGRERTLARALGSAMDQSIPVLVEVEMDKEGRGPGATRNRAVSRVRTPWIAFLDDDDELRPRHCEALLGLAESSGADLVWPQFDSRINNQRPTNHPPDLRSPVLDLSALDRDNFIPITYLVRTEVFRAVGGFREDFCPEDHQLLIDMRNAGMKAEHLRERTWIVGWHQLNTHGEPRRAWDYYPQAAATFDPEARNRDVTTMGAGLDL